MEDSKIIELYFSRSENAISETAAKYGTYLKTIAYNILHSTEDSEECANDTYMQAWNSIPPQRPVIFKAYIGRIARNLALNLYAKYTSAKRAGGRTAAALDELAECIPDRRAENTGLKDCLNEFLGGLPVQQRKIFVRRYWYMSSVKEIAQAYSLGESNVKMTLKRTRDKLKAYLENEGVSL